MDGESSPSRRRAPWGVLIVAVIAAIMGWVALSAWQRSEVEVSWASPPVCQGAQVRSSDTGALVDVRRSTRCRLRVTLTNHGWSRAHVGRVTFPGMGASGSVPLRVDQIGVERPDDSGGDAVLDLARTLGPGDALAMTVELVYNSDGCFDAGQGSYGNGVPVVAVSSYEQSGERHAPQHLVMRVPDGQQGSCPKS